MSNATTNATTIRPKDAAHFGRLAAEWWDPKGSSAMLHKLNPVRLEFLRHAIDAHWGIAHEVLRPLAGKRALDVGCGAGLVAEPLARLGAAVTGIDAAPENVAVAREHAAAMGLTIDYRQGEIATLGATGYDLVTSMEVLEHVADKAAFVAALAAALAPQGLLVLSTPNRTVRSRLLMVEAAERIGAIPRGTHRWDDFVTPDELRSLLTAAGLTVGAVRGIGWSPGKGLHLTEDLTLDYLITATRA
ncbi:MAG: bifunctional 2-polyprenyl-6-hydroxyphenol methylase/3-demethylubiquinol 3-O-methyltransferase UbiG [Novosphingobium sp.]|nr:bifunctional 2-polyprenyl-6-hydroxyphenol methylase/3-demethylubiquinol 3-O-methyltransferase UbiG [Novosphingobium sp.]